MAGKGTPAVIAAERAGIAFTVHEYSHDPAHESYGREAAEALGIESSRVCKTLVVALDDGRLAVGILPVDEQLDLKAVAHALGSKRSTMADVRMAERTTGYVIGGISPLGQRKKLPTALDETVFQHGTMFVSAGRRGLEIELAPRDLVTLTAAVVAPITRSSLA